MELESDLALNKRLLQFVSGGMSGALDIAGNIAQYCPDAEDLKAATKDIMLTFVNQENELKQYIEAMNHVRSLPVQAPPENSSASSSTIDPQPSLNSAFTEKLEQLKIVVGGGRKGKERNTLEQHKQFQELQQILASRESIEEQLSELRQRLNQGTEGDSQGDLALTGTEINTRCPYTGLTMQEPVQNKHCGHIYDREGILTYIKQKKAKAKCPVGGCGNVNPVQEADLEEHHDLRRYISLMSQTQGL